MECEMDYCVYNENLTCILDRVEINSIGMCEECQIVNISQEQLQFCKENQLNKEKELDKEYN